MSVIDAHRGTWLTDLTQLLDEHHLVVLSEASDERDGFARAMADHLLGFTSAQVVWIDGHRGATMSGLVTQVAEGLGLDAPIDGDLHDLVTALRTPSARVRWRYLIWNHADEMLEHEVGVFGEAVNAMLAVATEHEYLNPEPLIIQRIVFLGGAKLGAYAEEESGQFHRWLPSGNGSTFRGVASAQSQPKVMTYRIGE